MVDSKKHIRNCAICQSQYRYCNNCSEFEQLPTYMLRWCSANCRDIDLTLSAFGAHQITAQEAAEKLKTLDTSRIEYWNDNFRAAYNQVMAEAAGAESKPTPLDEFKEKEAAMLKKQKEEQTVVPHKKGTHTKATKSYASTKDKDDATK